MWVPDYVHMPAVWDELLLTQAGVLFNAVYLSVLLYQARASKSISFLPAPLFILTVAVLPGMRCHWQLQLWILAVLLFLHLVLHTGDHEAPNGYVFFFSLLLCILSPWIPDALWFVPYAWVVVLMFGRLSVRTLLASVIAAAVFAVYYGAAVYFGMVDDWSFMTTLFPRSWFAWNADVPDILSVVIVLLATIAIAASSFLRSSYGFVSTRMLLNHFVALFVIAVPFILFVRPASADTVAMAALAAPAVTGIYLLQKESESRGITFLAYVLVALALYVSSFLLV